MSDKIIMQGLPPCVENLMISALKIKTISDISKTKIDSLEKMIGKIRILSQDASVELRTKKSLINKIMNVQKAPGSATRMSRST